MRLFAKHGESSFLSSLKMHLPAWHLLLFPSDQLQTGKEDLALELWEAGSSGQFNTSGAAKPINPRGLAQQLFHFLVACNQQPSLPLTNKGILHKKQLQKLTEHLALPNDILRSAGLTYAFRDVYDEPAALMIEMAIRMGLSLFIAKVIVTSSISRPVINGFKTPTTGSRVSYTRFGVSC